MKDKFGGTAWTGWCAALLTAVLVIGAAAGFMVFSWMDGQLDARKTSLAETAARLEETEAKLANKEVMLGQARESLANVTAMLSAEKTAHAQNAKVLQKSQDDLEEAAQRVALLEMATAWQEVAFYAFPSPIMLFEMQIGLAYLLSEANGAPDTPDDSSPWERLQGFMALMDAGMYAEAYDEFLSPAFHEKCDREQFVTAAERKYTRTFLRLGAYVDSPIIEGGEGGVALVGLTFGLQKKDVIVSLSRSAEGGPWYVDWMPQFCGS